MRPRGAKSPAAASGREGFSHHETVTIGGQTPDGQDATNELSYIVLESTLPHLVLQNDKGIRRAARPARPRKGWAAARFALYAFLSAAVTAAACSGAIMQ
jgi:hypothetical protein